MNFLQKTKEAAIAVVPIIIIVLVLHFAIAPLTINILRAFIVGSFLIILGLGIFLAGADLGIVAAGSLLGASLTRTRKLPVILISVSITCFIITIAEPNLIVQGNLVESVTGNISARSLILSVSAGIAIAIVMAVIRIFFQVPYRLILFIAYGVAIFAASQVSDIFISIAFDSSGCATGPLTVPFIMALGIGIAGVRSDITATEDSFGTTGIAAVGPILAVAILGLIVTNTVTDIPADIDIVETPKELLAVVDDIVEIAKAPILRQYMEHLRSVIKDVTKALSPLALILIFFQITLFKMPPEQLKRLALGIFYTWLGLILFFLGANTGFIPTGTALGELLGALSWNWILIPIGCILGAVIVCAEPAVWVLTQQVEEISSGNIRRPILLATLAIGVAATVGLSMWRVLSGFSIWYFILPGFGLALLLTFFSPKLFTAIAFDSGSVATGPMASTFILTLTLGAALTSGGNPETDAFGLIAMIAVAPPISIQILGIIFHRKELYLARKSK